MNTQSDLTSLSAAFKLLASPARLQILLTIGRGEACVCHLESVLGWRQAYISQQLMALRAGGLLTTRREGRFVFYRLRNPAWLDLIQSAAELVGGKDFVLQLETPSHADSCTCPACRALPEV